MRTLAVIVWLVLALAAGVAMFHVTFKVEQLEAELRGLNREIVREQEAIHVLKAEWNYLNRPQRLELLASELLPRMKPPGAIRIGDLETLPARIETLRGRNAADAPVLPANSRSAGGENAELVR